MGENKSSAAQQMLFINPPEFWGVGGVKREREKIIATEVYPTTIKHSKKGCLYAEHGTASCAAV